MSAVNDIGALLVVSKLMDRGLSGDQIDSAMRQAVGHDWREIRVEAWLTRLQERHFPIRARDELYLDDLEALVRGRMKLDELF